jgi:glucosylceramidase
MGLGDTKIIVWDHNRDQMFERAQIILGDPQAAQYVWGVGFHWYGGEYFGHVQAVHDAFPETNLIFTEGCQEGGPHLGSWDLGERYARSMINDLNRWTVGWVDWNIILNQQGGPNHVGNFCSAPVIADTETDTLHYQSSYYYIGHFSRFIQPGAMRIVCTASQEWIEATAFQNPDGSIAVVVMNRTDETCPFYLRFRETFAELDIPARSIQTAVFGG